MIPCNSNPIVLRPPPKRPGLPQQLLVRWHVFDRPTRRPTTLEFLAFLYLTAPLIIFFASFATTMVAGPALAVILTVLYRARPRRLSNGIPDPRRVFLCMLTATLFLWACAYLPPFERTWDWTKHFAIINELAQNSWPPVNEATHTFL